MTTCHHTHCKKRAFAAAEALCASQGARFTEHRRKALEAVWQSHKALTASEVMQAMGTTQPPIAYRALEFLKEAGLVHHVASLNAYVGCLHAQEEGHIGQLLVCSCCRTVVELTPQQAMQELLDQAKAQGFAPQKVFVELLGLCPACQKMEA